MSIADTEKNITIVLDAAKRKECETIINKSAKSAALLGSVLIAGTDTGPFAVIQLKMIEKIGKALNIEISKDKCKKLFGIILPLVLKKGFADSITGMIPIIGNITGLSRASNTTKAIGWLVVGHFCNLNMEYLYKKSIFPKSRTKGIEEGYVLASLQYEEKFLDQAQKFNDEIEKIYNSKSKRKK